MILETSLEIIEVGNPLIRLRDSLGERHVRGNSFGLTLRKFANCCHYRRREIFALEQIFIC